MSAIQTQGGEKGPRVLGWVWGILLTVMSFSGFGQLPIFKRYYLADIPGMAWSADFYFTHRIHYLGAIFLMGLAGYVVFDYIVVQRRRMRLTGAGWVRVFLLAAIVLTGVFRVLKNLPDVSFSPPLTLLVDISHLGFMMAYLFAALAFRILGRGWVVVREVW